MVLGVGLRTGVHDCRMSSASDGERSPALSVHPEHQFYRVVLCVLRSGLIKAPAWPSNGSQARTAPALGCEWLCSTSVAAEGTIFCLG